MKMLQNTKNSINSMSFLAYLIGGMSFLPPAIANDMSPMKPPAPADEPPSVVLPMEAKQPGNYNFQASVQAPPSSVPFSGGKLGMITPVILNGLKYVDLETGLEIPPPWSKSLPPMPNPNLPPLPEPEPLPPAPNPPNHGRIMAVGKDPYNPGGVIITYQDGTIERVSPPSPKK